MSKLSDVLADHDSAGEHVAGESRSALAYSKQAAGELLWASVTW